MSRFLRPLIPALGLVFFLLPSAWSQPSGAPEDDLPPGAVARLGTMRLRHGEQVLSLAFAPDGKTLASAGHAGSVRLWETASGRQLRELPAGTGALVRFSTDGKYLVCAGSADDLSIRDAITGRVVRTFEDRSRFDDPIYVTSNAFVALAPDGKTLAEAAGMEVILWDTTTGKERRRLKGHTSPVLSVAFSPDGKLLAAGDYNNNGRRTTLLLWEVASGKEAAYIAGANQSETSALAFAPDGKTLASCSPYEICLWELATRKRPLRIEHGAHSLAYSPDGKLLAVAEHAQLGFIRILDAVKGKEVRTLRGPTALVNVIAFTPGGKLLASGGGPEGTIHLWDAATGREVVRGLGHASEVRAVAFTPDGRGVATASGADHTIRIWNTTSGASLLTIDIPCAQRSWLCPFHHADFLAFEPGGKTLICDNKVFDAALGRPTADLPGAALAVSADGRLLAGTRAGRHNAQVAVWERATGREVAHFAPFGPQNGGPSQITAAAFSSDGRVLAVGAADYNHVPGKPAKETIFLYDLAAGKLLRKFRPSVYRPAFLAFSPDGLLLATSAFWDEPVRLWRVADGQEVHKLAGHEDYNHGTDVRPLAFSPNGKFLAAAGKNNAVVLWETITGQEVHCLHGHRGVIRSLAFAPDGRTLLSAGADTTALLWSLAPPPPKERLTAKDADRLWRQLASDDAAAAYRAAWNLARQPAVALPVFKERLRPLPEPDPRQIAKLIADLDADEYTVRRAAVEKLKKLRSTAESTLRQALTGKPTLEARKRIDELLAELHQHPIPVEELRQLRAVQALEWMKAPGAAELLERLAGGSPVLRTTGDAKAALQRQKNTKSRGRSHDNPGS